ncbi:hypothetical protein [Streptomyces sp. NBC_00576]|uniref:hypothetical protein n=1 Tax=Streptomyces sp. NBC_00576 TaxID=2903665 RepID=UPI002E811842|nr:hypothetical protein [Streptomyces sp. NBC_00576]WUB73710.1 hypothetical protein OG734_28555 [Streptomyces sp. NBC_00576]
MFRQTPSTRCRIGAAYVDVCNCPFASAYVVDDAERSDDTSIFRPCNRAINNAAAVESADDAADFVSFDVAETSAVTEAANTVPDATDTSAVSAASTAATASAVRLSEIRGSLARPPEPGTHLPLSLNTTPVITL